jgi:cytosine/uracil/thiamine/allantoin permease
MVVTATPWMVIIGIHYLLVRGDYEPLDLHAFAIPGARGRYWYTAGLNLRAIVAWACAVALGLMFSATTLFTGPLVSAAKGVDLSWLVAAVTGGVVYALATVVSAPSRKARPEPEMELTATGVTSAL